MEYKRDPSPILVRGMQCDDVKRYYVTRDVLPRSYKHPNVKYPFDKRGCNALIYISPPQCKKTWKFVEFGETSSYFFLPFEILYLLKGIGLPSEYDTTQVLDELQAYITTFPKYVVVVQPEKLEFPLSLFFALDFNNMNEEHRTDYQSFKLVIQFIRDVIHINEFITQSTIKINGWEPINFRQQLNFGCTKLKLEDSNLSSKNCVMCKTNICGCLLHYSTQCNLKQVLKKDRTASLLFDPIFWTVLGTKQCKSLNQQECTQSITHVKYLTDWRKQFAVDNIILQILFPNSTFNIDENLQTHMGYDVLPLAGMHTIQSSEFYYGFRRDIEGYRYVTCAGGLGLKWFVSLANNSVTTILFIIRLFSFKF